MPNIQINIKDKVARADRVIIVCDNSDYTAVFDFDDEWSVYDTKTARFVYCGTYTDVVFTGNSCPIPEIHDTRSLTIGVYAGDLHTTTPAYVSCVPSILCGNGIPADPTPDVYAQIMELLNKESGIWYPAVDDAGNMSWTRSISETEPQPVNIKGPKGDAGADGIGSPGADGKDGVDGKSAYELAQDNGFQGTMQEWLASLVGSDGKDGNDGVSPAVSVAAITGGNRVTITDAEGAKTFDVMDGAQGASGADGKDYVLTDADKQEIAEAAAGLVDVPSVQPDWNQNDTTAADYIKNRPFYTGDPVKTVLVEEQTVAFSDIDGVYAVQGWPTNFDAVVGKTYTVYWDGTEYECECLSMKSIPYIGNLALLGAEIDTGEPFIFMNQGAWVVGTNDTASEHSISISSIVHPVTKIDEKYLPIATSNNAGIGTKDVIYIDGIYTEAELKNLISYWQKYKYDKIFLYSNECHTVVSMNLSNGTFNCRLPKYNFSVVPNDDGLYDLNNGTIDYNWCYAPEFHLISDGADIGISKDTFRNLPENSIVALKINSNVEVEDLYVQDRLYIKQVNETRDLCIYMDADGLIRVKYGYNSNNSAIWSKTMFLNSDKELILTSSTEGSTKKFRITVDDSGSPTITNESDSTNTWKPTNLPTVTASDAGKFLRVSDTGEWVAETIPNASGVNF